MTLIHGGLVVFTTVMLFPVSPSKDKQLYIPLIHCLTTTLAYALSFISCTLTHADLAFHCAGISGLQCKLSHRRKDVMD